MNPRSRSPIKHLVASAATTFGHFYAVGPRDSADGIVVCEELARHRIHPTLGKLSSATDDPDQIVREYCQASNALKAAGQDNFHLALKPPALEFQRERAVEITATALRNGHGVHVDSHGDDVADPTFALLDQLLQLNRGSVSSPANQFSVTIPARWRRSAADVDWAIERQLRVRLVKGEFPAANPADEVEPRWGFLSLLYKLAGRVPAIAIATHDEGLAREALTRARQTTSSVELELLYGFPADGLIAVAKDLAIPLGFYVPYSETLLVYAVRHLLQNPHKLARGNYFEALGSTSSRLAHLIALVEGHPKPSRVAL